VGARLTADELLLEARRGLDRVPPAQLADEMAAGALVVDIRPADQRARDGDLPGALVVDRNALEWRLDPSSQHRIPQVNRHDQRVILVCNQGYQSSLAAATLRRFGLHRATDLAGGFEAWLGFARAAAADVAPRWDALHADRSDDELSWFQPDPRASLELVASTGVSPAAAMIDVGGGSSRVVDGLLDRHHRDLTVLDVSAEALARARDRLGATASHVSWIVSDVRTWRPDRRYELWHDRAVFHFLVDPPDRAAYLAVLEAALAPGGWVVMATFAEDGPAQCSGLPTARYSVDGLLDAMGPDFALVTSRREEHRTPAGGSQPFTWVVVQARR